MSQAVKAILDATAGVTSLLADGAGSIRHLQERQGQSVPYIVIESDVVDPHNTMSGQSLDEIAVSVYVVSDGQYESSGAETIAELVRTALHGTSGTYASEVIKSISHERSSTQLFKSRVVVEQEYKLFKYRS